VTSSMADLRIKLANRREKLASRIRGSFRDEIRTEISGISRDGNASSITQSVPTGAVLRDLINV